MARLYKRGRFWWYYWHGERESTHCTDRKAAEAVFADVQRRYADPYYRPPNETTLGAALKTFIAHKRENDRAAGTLSMYDGHIAHLARVMGEHTPLSAIDAKSVSEYLSARHAEGASRSTQWKELCTLRGTLKLARHHGDYGRTLDQVMPADFKIEYVPLERHLSLPDIHKLLGELPRERRAVVAFIVATAADSSSVWLAQPGDVDLKTGRARVRGTKTSHRDRTVPILPVFADLAKEAAAGIPFESWASMRRDVMRAATRAGVGDPHPKTDGRIITARDLRRSHARILRAAGTEPHLIGRMLGHADSKMVERVYGRLKPEELGDLIGRHFSKPRTKLAQSTGRKGGKKRKSSKKKAAA